MPPSKGAHAATKVAVHSDPTIVGKSNQMASDRAVEIFHASCHHHHCIYMPWDACRCKLHIACMLLLITCHPGSC